MRIAVSACLLGENCKYNGGNNYSEKVRKFVEGHDVVPVCPEVLGGLPIPREPAEIVNGMVSRKDGTSVDREFRSGAEKAMEIVRKNRVEVVILQSRSPSCGVNAIYDGSFSGISTSCKICKKFRACRSSAFNFVQNLHKVRGAATSETGTKCKVCTFFRACNLRTHNKVQSLHKLCLSG